MCLLGGDGGAHGSEDRDCCLQAGVLQSRRGGGEEGDSCLPCPFVQVKLSSIGCYQGLEGQVKAESLLESQAPGQAQSRSQGFLGSIDAHECEERDWRREGCSGSCATACGILGGQKTEPEDVLGRVWGT